MRLKLTLIMFLFLVIAVVAISDGHFASERSAMQGQVMPGDDLVIPSVDEKWGEVRFTHQQHLPYSDCTYCHHTNKGLTLENFKAGKSERIPFCAECHLREEGNPKTVRSADGLELWSKEAYHINCIDCHKGEITRVPKDGGKVLTLGKGPTKCSECHAPAGEKSAPPTPPRVVVKPTNSPFTGLPRSSPEAQGIDSRALSSVIDTLDRNIETMNSVMLVRHGHIVAEGYWDPYDAETRHALYSLTKSFTSSAVGFAVAEKKLQIEDQVLRFFPDDAPAAPSANLREMRVRDLLTMSAGHSTEASNKPGEHWTKNFLAQPVEHKPGTYFLYNTPASHMLSAIVEKVTGQTTLDYLAPRLFQRLAIKDPVWMSSPQGVTSGGWGLKLRTREIAHFGQFYLQKGKWQDEQVLPSSWIEMATSEQISNSSNKEPDWQQGYGFQFWRSRYGSYRGDGAFGQYCVVMPEKDAVLVITSGVKNMQSVLDLVWKELLPIFGEKALSENPSALKELDARLKALRVPPASGTATPARTTAIFGKPYRFPANELKIESISLNADSKGALTLALRREGAEQRLPIGSGTWEKGTLAYGNWPEQPVAVSGAWAEPDLLHVKIVFREEPFILTLRLRFAESQLNFDGDFNVFFRGPTKQPSLVGTR